MMRRATLPLLALLVVFCPVGSLQAAIVATGNVEPNPETTPWSDATYGYVGNSADGSLTVDGASDLFSYMCRIGTQPGTFGRVTINGNGSTWISQRDIVVGSSGNGTLAIADGATVGNGWTGWIGRILGSTGYVTVSGVGSKWSSSNLRVGDYGNGMLSITEGGGVSSSGARIGSLAGSTGTVSVDGAGSLWTNTGEISVGVFGDGTLAVTDGGMISSHFAYIGDDSGSNGAVTISGVGSTWTNTGDLCVGFKGHGTLAIMNGGVVNSEVTGIGGSKSVSTVTVNGSGSLWNNSGNLIVGAFGSGRLLIADGGAVTAAGVWLLNNQPLLAINVGGNSRLTVGGGTGTITNSGTVRILAGAGAAPGEIYTPILARTGEGGVYQAVGGTWHSVEHEFVASPVICAGVGMRVGFDAATIQRVLVTDQATGRSVGLSLLAPDQSTMLSVTAAPVDGEVVGELAALLEDGQVVRGAWEFDVDGYNSSNPAYLSFSLGQGFIGEDLAVWHYDGEGWSAFDAWDLTYDDQYASFTVSGFSAYAVVAPVPEPAMVVLLAGLAVAAVVARRR